MVIKIRISLLNYISVNEKDKLIWTETFEVLQMFVEGLNIPNGTWSCRGGDSKQCKAKDLCWYPDTQSITLNGKLKETIKEQLVLLVSVTKQLNESEDNQQSSHNSENINFEVLNELKQF